jgi:hypothetical protein
VLLPQVLLPQVPQLRSLWVLRLRLSPGPRLRPAPLVRLLSAVRLPETGLP